jgi:hypothetical protein
MRWRLKCRRSHCRKALRAFSTVKSDIMTAAFIEAKVPDCLHSEGLKRQPTFIFTGLPGAAIHPHRQAAGEVHLACFILAANSPLNS